MVKIKDIEIFGLKVSMLRHFVKVFNIYLLLISKEYKSIDDFLIINIFKKFLIKIKKGFNLIFGLGSFFFKDFERDFLYNG